MNKPCAIEPGDTLAFVAPATHSDPEKYQHAISVFEYRGYKIKIGKCCDQPPTVTAGPIDNLRKNFRTRGSMTKSRRSSA